MSDLQARIKSAVSRRRYEQQSSEHAKAAVSGEPRALTYLGLHHDSLALVGSRRRVRRTTNLLLPELSGQSLFAGIRTAVEVGLSIALRSHDPLRIIVFNSLPTRPVTVRLINELSTEFHVQSDRISVISVHDLHSEGFSEDDTWIATYWTNAHALDIASRLGLISAKKVIYLIQDYEPSFLPASTFASLARATYHAGFVPLVNSSPLREYLNSEESIDVDVKQTFAPRLDMDRLNRSARERVKSAEIRVLFYGRPTKPRNMFGLGLSALRSASVRLGHSGRSVIFQSIGEAHADMRLSEDAVLRSIGKVQWGAYFSKLAQADLLLSLQASPHPSHPPLDMVVSGGIAVTNEIGTTRSQLHPRLLATAPDPDELASSIFEAAELSTENTNSEFDGEFVSSLGSEFEDAIDAAVAKTER